MKGFMTKSFLITNYSFFILSLHSVFYSFDSCITLHFVLFALSYTRFI